MPELWLRKFVTSPVTQILPTCFSNSRLISRVSLVTDPMALLGTAASRPRTGEWIVMSDSILPQTFDLVSSNPRQHFWSHPPIRLTIDGTGIRVDFGPERSKTQRWDDPKFQFALLDYRVAMVQNPRFVFTPTLFEFRFDPPPPIRFYLSEEAFQALSTVAEARGLIMVRGRPCGGLVAGTIIRMYGRELPE